MTVRQVQEILQEGVNRQLHGVPLYADKPVEHVDGLHPPDGNCWHVLGLKLGHGVSGNVYLGATCGCMACRGLQGAGLSLAAVAAAGCRGRCLLRRAHVTCPPLPTPRLAPAASAGVYNGHPVAVKVLPGKVGRVEAAFELDARAAVPKCGSSLPEVYGVCLPSGPGRATSIVMEYVFGLTVDRALEWVLPRGSTRQRCTRRQHSPCLPARLLLLRAHPCQHPRAPIPPSPCPQVRGGDQPGRQDQAGAAAAGRRPAAAAAPAGGGGGGAGAGGPGAPRPQARQRDGGRLCLGWAGLPCGCKLAARARHWPRGMPNSPAHRVSIHPPAGLPRLPPQLSFPGSILEPGAAFKVWAAVKRGHSDSGTGALRQLPRPPARPPVPPLLPLVRCAPVLQVRLVDSGLVQRYDRPLRKLQMDSTKCAGGWVAGRWCSPGVGVGHRAVVLVQAPSPS